MPYTYPGDYRAEQEQTETDPRVTPASYAPCGHAIYADGSGPDCGCSNKCCGKEQSNDR
jgi:hypothetical protein